MSGSFSFCQLADISGFFRRRRLGVLDDRFGLARMDKMFADRFALAMCDSAAAISGNDL